MSSRIAIAALALLFQIAPVFAAPTPGPTSEAARADDPLIAVKRDFDEFHTPSSEAHLAKGDFSLFALPSVAGPDTGLLLMPGNPTATARKPADDEAGRPKAASDHWLLDLYDRQRGLGQYPISFGVGPRTKGEGASATSDRQSDSPDLRADALDRKTDRDDSSKASSDLSVDSSDSEPRHPPPPEHADNPLDRYMASWITPRDQTVLLATLQPDSAHSPSDAPSPVAEDTQPLIALSDFGLPNSSFDGAATPSLSSSDQSRDNPYLALLNAPAEPAPASASSPTQTLTTFSAVPAAEPALSSPSSLSDLSRSSDDDKYFKQLKRF